MVYTSSSSSDALGEVTRELASSQPAKGSSLEDAAEELALYPAGEGSPVGAHRLEAADDHRALGAVVTRPVADQTGVALLRSARGAAGGGHEEAVVVRLELELEVALDP